MEASLNYILGLLVIYSIYFTGKFLLAIFLGVHEQHLFLGYGKHPALTFSIKGVKVSLGLFIPLPLLAKYYSFKDGKKERIPYEWEYFNVPLYKRLLVTFGGSFSMLLSSIIIFTVLEFNEQDVYISKNELNKDGIYPSSMAREAGFQEGDKIVAVIGQDFERSNDLFNLSNFKEDSVCYLVVRNKDSVLVWLNIDNISNDFYFYPSAPVKIINVLSESEAERCGLKANDLIVEVEGTAIKDTEIFKNLVNQNASKSISILVKRDTISKIIQANVPEDGILGISAVPYINYTVREKSVLENIKNGFVKPFEILISNISALQKTFTGSIAPRKSVSGPIHMAQIFGERSISHFFYIIAIILILSAFYDFLPLPQAAGFKAIPLISEGIFSKKFRYKSYKSLNKAIWIIIGIGCGLIVISDIMLLF